MTAPTPSRCVAPDPTNQPNGFDSSVGSTTIKCGHWYVRLHRLRSDRYHYERFSVSTDSGQLDVVHSLDFDDVTRLMCALRAALKEAELGCPAGAPIEAHWELFPERHGVQFLDDSADDSPVEGGECHE